MSIKEIAEKLFEKSQEKQELQELILKSTPEELQTIIKSLNEDEKEEFKAEIKEALLQKARTHKYIRKEGIGAQAKYIYKEGEKKVPKDSQEKREFAITSVSKDPKDWTHTDKENLQNFFNNLSEKELRKRQNMASEQKDRLIEDRKRGGTWEKVQTGEIRDVTLERLDATENMIIESLAQEKRFKGDSKKPQEKQEAAKNQEFLQLIRDGKIKVSRKDGEIVYSSPKNKEAEKEAYTNWVGEIYQEIEELAEVTTSDAQGLVDAQELQGVLKPLWDKKLTAKDAAKAVNEAALVKEPKASKVSHSAMRQKATDKVADMISKVIAEKNKDLKDVGKPQMKWGEGEGEISEKVLRTSGFNILNKYYSLAYKEPNNPSLYHVVRFFGDTKPSKEEHEWFQGLNDAHQETIVKNAAKKLMEKPRSKEENKNEDVKYLENVAKLNPIKDEHFKGKDVPSAKHGKILESIKEHLIGKDGTSFVAKDSKGQAVHILPEDFKWRSATGPTTATDKEEKPRFYVSHPKGSSKMEEEELKSFLKGPQDEKEARKKANLESAKTRLESEIKNKVGSKQYQMNNEMMLKEILEKESEIKKSSNPSLYKTPESLTQEEILAVVRQDIIAELDAVNLYEAHAQATDNKELKQILRHIIDEEKEHSAELQAFLNKYDAKQKEAFSKEIMKKAMQEALVEVLEKGRPHKYIRKIGSGKDAVYVYSHPKSGGGVEIQNTGYGQTVGRVYNAKGDKVKEFTSLKDESEAKKEILKVSDESLSQKSKESPKSNVPSSHAEAKALMEKLGISNVGWWGKDGMKGKEPEGEWMPEASISERLFSKEPEEDNLYEIAEKKLGSKVEMINKKLEQNGFKPNASITVQEKGYVSIDFKLEPKEEKPQEKKPTAFQKWLDTFFKEKGTDLDQSFEVEGESGTNFMTYQTVVDHIKMAPKHEQKAIKDMIVKIDFHNAKVEPFLKHLAQAIAKSTEENIDLSKGGLGSGPHKGSVVPNREKQTEQAISELKDAKSKVEKQEMSPEEYKALEKRIAQTLKKSDDINDLIGKVEEFQKSKDLENTITIKKSEIDELVEDLFKKEGK